MKLDIEPRAALDALAHHIDHQRAALLDADDRHTEALRIAQAEVHILRQVIAEHEADVERLTTALGEANAARIALREGAPVLGKLLGYQHLEAVADITDPYPHHVDATCWYGATDYGKRRGLADARKDGYRVAAVYLLPEGGQS